MNKKIIIILVLMILVTGCSSKEKKYTEKSITYTIGEEKVVVKHVPEKPAYTSTELLGKTTGWGLKPRYAVGHGADIEPGMYNVVTSGWANYNIFIGAVEVDLNSTENYSGAFRVSPLARDICYISERNCAYKYDGYKEVQKLLLVSGDVLYVSYTPFSGQDVSIRFEAQYVTINHPKEEEIPEVSVEPLEIKESIRKYKDSYKCYINGYEVPDCDALNHYDDIMKKFK